MADSSFCLHLSFPLTVPSSGFCGCKTNAAFERWKLSQGRPSMSPCLRPPVSPLPPQRPPPFPDRPGLDRNLLPPSSSWVSSSSAASSVASEAGWFRISAGGVPEDTEDTSEDTSQQDRRARTGHRLYLVLLDASQVPAEAQADLPALPVLQEEHGYTHTHTDRFRGRSGDVSTGAVHRRSHPTET